MDDARCIHCNEWFGPDNSSMWWNVCGYCFDNHYARCNDCGEIYACTELIRIGGRTGHLYCSYCTEYGHTDNSDDISNWIGAKVDPDGMDGMTWVEYDKYAQFTGQIDYGCRFDGDGCQGTTNTWKGRVRGCCDICSDMNGYVTAVRPGSEQTYIDAWSEAAGFWSSDGCKLPRNCRSLTCLEYRCYDVACSDSKDDREFWGNVRRFPITRVVKLVQIETPVSV